MAKAPAFQLYASDFYMDTASWTISETGIYMRLLMHQWVETELPTEMSRLARIAGCDVRTMQKCWSAVIAKKFATNERGKLQNYRLEESRKERGTYIKKQVESGSNGGKTTQDKNKNLRGET